MKPLAHQASLKSLKNEGSKVALEDLIPADRLRMSETSSMTGDLRFGKDEESEFDQEQLKDEKA